MYSKKYTGMRTTINGSGPLCSGGTAAGLDHTADASCFKLGGGYMVSYILDSYLRHRTSFSPLFRLTDTG